MKPNHLIIFLLFFPLIASAQQRDSVIKVDQNYVTLSEVVVNRSLDVAAFIKKIKEDTTFYKAFKNLHIIGYKAINDIRLLDKKGNIESSLKSTTRQIVKNNCREMEVIDQKTTGNFFDKNGNYNSYTASLYASWFFTNGTVCGENNIVKGTDFNASGLHGMEKHKAQLKMLFFNPGKKITGLPFISGKTAIFDDGMAENYDMKIDYEEGVNGPAYLFSIDVKPGRKDRVVIDHMTTWFDANTFEILARKYALSYDAGVYDFDVSMNIKMARIKHLLVPVLITYNGNWKAIFKKRERAIFTATLSELKL